MFERMPMPDLRFVFRFMRPAQGLALLAVFAVATPAAAEDAPLPYELTAPAETVPAPKIDEEP
jgi:hypothetical protein